MDSKALSQSGTLKQIRQDAATFTLALFAGLTFFYLETVGGIISTDSLIGQGGIFMAMLFAVADGSLKFERTTSKFLKNKELYETGLAILGFFVLNLIVPQLPHGLSSTNVQGYQPFTILLFSLDMAIAEEQIFRGFFVNYLAFSKFGPHFKPNYAAVIDGAVFGVYHWGVYGGDPSAIIIVAGAGMVMSAVDLSTGRLLPSTIAHLINNFLSSGGIVGFALMGLFSGVPELLLLIVIAAIAINFYSKRKG
ncbi:MAG: CPBP family intramembrane metalloprotease [Patescibacteria group bacterium]|nr:CPBP family intramembrane metalloprotease [Patescibacteria group bacterium]